MRLGPVLVGAAILVAASVGAALAVPAPATGADGDTTNATNATDGNATMGATLSSYMQAQSGKTDGAVEQGMWNASVSRTRNRAAVDARTEAMTRQLARLEERRAALRAAYENGSITEMQYRARLAGIVARLLALDDAVDDTAAVAREVGANVSALRGLGEDVAAERARIPDDVGPAGHAGNRTASGQENGVPPGQADDAPPGRSDDRTPPGQSNGSGSPAGGADGAASGQADNRTSQGRAGNATPPSQTPDGTAETPPTSVGNDTSGANDSTTGNDGSTGGEASSNAGRGGDGSPPSPAPTPTLNGTAGGRNPAATDRRQ